MSFLQSRCLVRVICSADLCLCLDGELAASLPTVLGNVLRSSAECGWRFLVQGYRSASGNSGSTTRLDVGTRCHCTVALWGDPVQAGDVTQGAVADHCVGVSADFFSLCLCLGSSDPYWFQMPSVVIFILFAGLYHRPLVFSTACWARPARRRIRGSVLLSAVDRQRPCESYRNPQPLLRNEVDFPFMSGVVSGWQEAMPNTLETLGNWQSNPDSVLERL